MKTSISNNLYQIRVVAVFIIIRDLCCIRRFISLSVAKTIATAQVSNNLDYCNSLLYNTAIKDIAKLQRVQFIISKGSHAFSSFFLLSAASKIIALVPCALSHYLQELYNSVASILIYTTSISKFDANFSKKFQTATLNQ